MIKSRKNWFFANYYFRRHAFFAIIMTGWLLLTACAASNGTDAPTELVVFAASSLTDAFTEMAQAFE
ncbi:MAG: hypothetical protein KC413_24965, partial [Anaerolineales bacterium]|nr:hypothetical protein [Anaerolineales bacterium]